MDEAFGIRLQQTGVLRRTQIELHDSRPLVTLSAHLAFDAWPILELLNGPLLRLGNPFERSFASASYLRLGAEGLGSIQVDGGERCLGGNTHTYSLRLPWASAFNNFKVSSDHRSSFPKNGRRASPGEQAQMEEYSSEDMYLQCGIGRADAGD